jgi:beta-glucosidase
MTFAPGASGSALKLMAACAAALVALGGCGGRGGRPPAPSEDLLFARGGLPQGWRWESAAPDGLPAPAVAAADRIAREDARRFTWAGGGEGTVSIVPAAPVDLSRRATAELGLLVDYRVEAPPSEDVSLWMACGDHCGGTVPIGGILRAAPAGEWRTLVVPIRCFVRAGLDPKAIRTPFAVTTAGRLTLAVSGVRLASAVAGQNKCGAS